MTATITRPDTLEEFDRALDELLIGIASRAVEREQNHTLLYEEVRALQEIGFGSIRFPVEWGGLGLSFEQVIERLILVASADSNLAHLYRGHIAVVEEVVAGYDADEENRAAWRERIARGDFIGNAQSEKQETGQITTRIEREGDEILLTGRKYYTTGSIYADWIRLAALDGDTRVGVTVSTQDPGVESTDDWDGFGQPLTGTGTTVFDRVAVAPADVIVSGEHPARGHHIAAVFQLILLAAAAGIGQATLRDAVEFVRPRRRIFGFSGETLPREDALVQETIGSVSARADAAVRLVVSIRGRERRRVRRPDSRRIPAAADRGAPRPRGGDGDLRGRRGVGGVHEGGARPALAQRAYGSLAQPRGAASPGRGRL
jgi:alkylation response protein AidB-like acyl-CoA dehydrogenase